MRSSRGRFATFELPKADSYPWKYTFQANLEAAIHRWFRLTASFGYPLVHDIVEELELPRETLVLDPFCGTGTVPVVCQSLGLPSVSVEWNPFLAELTRLKTRAPHLSTARLEVERDGIVRAAEALSRRYRKQSMEEIGHETPWGIPPVANIENWWSAPFLKDALAIRHAIHEAHLTHLERSFFMIAASVILTDHENSRGHVSLSYSRVEAHHKAIDWFQTKTNSMIEDVRQVGGHRTSPAIVLCGDSTNIGKVIGPYLGKRRVGAVITSPPYCNRFTYTRETRAQLYYGGLLRGASEAGALDRVAIGGTWGLATHVMRGPKHRKVPRSVREAIGRPLTELQRKRDRLPHNYAAKFFEDLYRHLRTMHPWIRRGAPLVYVVGDSILSEVHIPTQEILGRLMEETGYVVRKTVTFRSRNNRPVSEACVVAMRK